MRNGFAKKVALGGMLAALGVVIMFLGGLIPVATFICPAICMILLWLIYRLCGHRLGWAWYGAVSILCGLLAPDREAAFVFIFIGWYPLVKPRLDKSRLGFIWKLLVFNVAILAMYQVLIHLLGVAAISREFQELGTVMTAVTLVLGNVTFFLLDICLNRIGGIRK